MRFWDASAIVPLYTAEPGRERLLALLDRDPDVLVWWATPVEVTAALARLERDRHHSSETISGAVRRLELGLEHWQRVVPTDAVRRNAQRLLRVHALRAADALQLAAAFVASESTPATLEFVCLDERLAGIARREGFPVVPE